MKSLNPMLNFDGKAEEAFRFYRSVFGGEFTSLMRWSDSPMAAQVKAEERNRVMHVALPLPCGSVLMGADACSSFGKHLTMGNNVHICFETDSEAETDALFAKLSAGGQTHMSPQKMFWGAYFASFADRFGVLWMFNHTYPKAGD